MKIREIRSWTEYIELTRPYTIAFNTTGAVSIVVVRLETDSGLVGLGAATPVETITGESLTACEAALREAGLEWLLGRDVRELNRLCREAGGAMAETPAARAAVDMALYDVFAQHLEAPLVDVLGRAHDVVPTSITIGIKPTDEAIAEAEEYVGRGFRVLKVKLGKSVEKDIERVLKLRERLGNEVFIRVDPNQGYSVDDLVRFDKATRNADVEFIEQPLPADAVEEMMRLPESLRERTALDESLQADEDALRLAAAPRACGIFNIKLMKCGGVYAARRIATVAELAGMRLMWGCMDESRISIAAALHTGLASPATKYLDLDGHLDLARDVADGGFVLEDGVMRTTNAPGLGLRFLE